MTPHREWFCEYEKYNGGDVFLRDDSTTKIIGHARVKLLLKDGRIKTLLWVLHIHDLDRNLISVSKMSDDGVHVVFEEETCIMVQGAMVFMRGVRIGTLYKLLGSTINDGYNNFVIFEGSNEEDGNPTILGEKIMLWHQRPRHIGEKGL